MCENFAGTEVNTVDEWKALNKLARSMVTSIKGGPRYGKEISK